VVDVNCSEITQATRALRLDDEMHSPSHPLRRPFPEGDAHELRYTAASLAIASGASVKGVQSMLGHASATLTLDRCGHLFGDQLDAVPKRIDVARTGAFSKISRPAARRRCQVPVLVFLIGSGCRVTPRRGFRRR
jgi:hypothetical protein